MTYEKGKEFYEGKWKNGAKHGKGTYKYMSGDIYHGSWVKDCRHG